VNVETKEQSKHFMHTHSPNKTKKLKKTLSTCQKADDNCFLGQDRNADGGIHAIRDYNNARSVLQNTKKKLHRAIQNKGCGMLISDVVLLHDNDRLHTAACTQALLSISAWSCLTTLHTAPISL
jgi:ribosomal protein L4